MTVSVAHERPSARIRHLGPVGNGQWHTGTRILFVHTPSSSSLPFYSSPSPTPRRLVLPTTLRPVLPALSSRFATRARPPRGEARERSTRRPQRDLESHAPEPGGGHEEAAAMEAPSWDGLRKQARRLEAQLDDKMNAYRKLVSTKSDGSENDIESDIERSLKQLQQVNSQMQTWVSSGGSEVHSHTLTRHMEILQDLTQEFYRLRSSLRAKQQHSSLLDLRDFDRAKFYVEETADSSDQALLKEQTAISRSTGQMDNVISQAQATLGALMSQRSTFGGITTKISNVSSRLPTINHILSSIRRKKSMDTIILSLVASVSAFLIFVYWLSK